MFTKADRKEQLKNLAEAKRDLEARISAINKEVYKVNKATVFEDTYSGIIQAEEEKTVKEINKLLTELHESTGKKYAKFSVGPCSIPKNEVSINFEDTDYQRDVIVKAIRFCKNQGSWDSNRSLHSWISKIIKEELK